MTSYGKAQVERAITGNHGIGSYRFHNTERMLSYKELSDAGIFKLTRNILVDREKILAIELPEGTPEDVSQRIDRLKEKPDGMAVMEAIDFVEEKMKEKGKNLMKQLFGAVSLDKDETRGASLSQNYSHGMGDTKTPTWMAHKAADFKSTNQDMMTIVGGTEPVEPYKKNKASERTQLIDSLKKQMKGCTVKETVLSSKDASWLEGRFDFVQSNRGFFLLGNNYIDEEGATKHLNLKIKNNDIELGGSSGAYQVQIKPGDTFTLQDPENTEMVISLVLKEGKLTEAS